MCVKLRLLNYLLTQVFLSLLLNMRKRGFRDTTMYDAEHRYAHKMRNVDGKPDQIKLLDAGFVMQVT